RAGLDRPLLGELAAARDRLAAIESLKYLIDFAADLGDRGADRIGAAAVLDANDPADPVQSIGNEEARAAHAEGTGIPGPRREATRVRLDHRTRGGEPGVDQCGSKVRALAAVADLGEPCRHGDIRRGEGRPAEHQRLLGQPETDALRADRDAVRIDDA